MTHNKDLFYPNNRAELPRDAACSKARRRAASARAWRAMEILEPRQLLSGTDPVLVVAGNGLNIGFHDNSPRLADGTDFGILTSGPLTAADTFIISNGGAGTLALSGPVTFTGANAADFSADAVVAHTDGTFSVTVHFAPTAAGQENAALHIASNDPKHPDFSFAVRGTAAFTDFSTEVGAFKVKNGGVISDGTTQFSVPVKVTNIGGLTVNGSAGFTDVQLFLRNASGGTETLVATADHQSLNGLGLNKSRTINVKFTIPFGLDAGDYTVVARLNGSGAIAETNPLNSTPLVNNSDGGTTTLAVTQGHIDLAGNLVSTTILPAVLNDTAFSGKLVVNVQNLGNVALPNNQKVSLEIRAHNGSGDIVLATVSNISLSKLKAGGSKNVTLSINDTGGIAAGAYQIQALITPAPALSEDGSVNNLITQTASGQTFTLISGSSFVNLSGFLVKSTVPAVVLADHLIKGSLQVTVRNVGNVTLSSSQQMRLEIYAEGLPLTVSGLLSIKSLAPGATKTYSVSINVPSGLAAGSYHLQARIAPSPVLAESDADDNLITLTAVGGAIPLTIT